MRDDRHLMRWLDLSWFAPMPLSLGLAVWAVMTRPDPGVLATLVLVQTALLASACGVPAGIAAARSRVWLRRRAPRAFAAVVHKTWREQMLALLVLGLTGPAAAAARALDMGDIALACWALALPLLGAGLGTLAAWAWSGSLPPAGVALWPTLACTALLLGLAPRVWLDAQGAAALSLAAGLLLLAGTWQVSRQLQPRWTGVQPLLVRWSRRHERGPRRWYWDTLAFDDANDRAQQGPSRLWSQYLPYFILGLSGASPLQAVMADDISGWLAVHLTVYVAYLLSFAGTGLVVRVAHWRLRLAPRALRPSTQVALMLAESTLALCALSYGFIAFHAWRQGLDPAALVLPSLRVALDAATGVALGAWLRGLNNTRLAMTLAWLGTGTVLAALLWLAHLQGLVLTRKAPFLAAQAMLTVLLVGLALRAWRQRVPRGQTQLAAIAPD